MRVLFVSRYLPWPLYNGGAVRTFAIISGLAKLHRITLAVPEPGNEQARRELEAAYANIVERFLWVPVPPDRDYSNRGNVIVRVLRSFLDLFSHWLPLAFREAAGPWRIAIDKHDTEFDAAFCRYAWLSPAFFGVGLKRVVFDLDDVQFLFLWRELGTARGTLRKLRGVAEVSRTWLAEQVISFHAARVLTCSREDANFIMTRRKTVIPNGMTIESGPKAQREPDIVVFVGYCKWMPNRHGLQWFIESVWPLVLAKRPSARFRIVGRGANIATLPFATHASIELNPDVPSVKPWVEGAVVSIAPILFAGGTRIKVVESLGYGTPVVATTIGAAGLTEIFDESTGLYVVDGAEQTAAQICTLLADPAQAFANAARGTDIVVERYTWERVVRPIAENIEQWVGSNSHR
mgnify:CR=1 FL=1|jgi:glycosyltransferase involved in cell wall biosynthesis|tara:strand:+ start:2616 stop:3833 length:1218 start_codon:yes stop_codon:yes gene_type:complete